jgi:hypothetical protein
MRAQRKFAGLGAGGLSVTVDAVEISAFGGGDMVHARKLIAPAVLLVWLCVALHAGVVRADSIGPAQEQELSDAKAALESARKAPVEKYAAAQIKHAQDNLQDADAARQAQDATKFSRLARLARAYAELAAAMADYGAVADQLASTSESVQKARIEVELLTKQK